jgi:uncharacterized membrane protein HdeD (DUF308 family)
VTILKALGGAVAALAGVWTLAEIPVVNPFPLLVVGWTLLLTGLAILAPALFDLLADR